MASTEHTEDKLTYSAIMNKKISTMVTEADRAMEGGDFRHCVAVLTRAVALNPQNPILFHKRADAYFELNDYSSAIVNYKKTVSLAPEKATELAIKMADTHFRYGDVFSQRGEHEAALEEYTIASNLRPCERDYIIKRIHCLLALGRSEDGLKMIETELERGLPRPQLYLMHAKINLIYKKNNEVYKSLNKALELDPTHQEAIQLKEQQKEQARKLQSQAVKFLLLGQRDGAMSKITTAIECDPEEPQYLVLRGAIYRQNGDYPRAVEELLTAVDKCGDEGEGEGMDGGGEGRGPVSTAACRQLTLTYNDFAVHCFKRKNYDEAIQLLNKALEDEKKEAGLYVNRGDCYCCLDNLYFALADYCRAQQLSPGDWEIRCRVAVTQCELGVKEFSGGNITEANKLFSGAICNNPKVSRFYLYRARLKFELKQTEAAREDLFHVLALEPDCDACLPLIARLFPARTQSDLLKTPEFNTASTKLMQSIQECDKRESKGERVDVLMRKESTRNVEHELQEIFSQLRLL